MSNTHLTQLEALALEWIDSSGFLDTKSFASSRELLTGIAHQMSHFKEWIIRGYQIVLTEAEHRGGPQRRNRLLIHESFIKQIREQDNHWDSTDVQGLQKALHFSNEAMADMYDIAVSLSASKHYPDAICVYCYLIFLNPFVSYFWQELARCWCDLHQWDDALYAFCVGINCNPCDPHAYRCAVNACLDTRNYEIAESLLQYGIEVVNQTEDSAHGRNLKHLRDMLAFVKAKRSNQ